MKQEKLEESERLKKSELSKKLDKTEESESLEKSVKFRIIGTRSWIMYVLTRTSIEIAAICFWQQPQQFFTSGRFMDRFGFDNVLPTLLLFGAVVAVAYSINLILVDRETGMEDGVS